MQSIRITPWLEISDEDLWIQPPGLSERRHLMGRLDLTPELFPCLRDGWRLPTVAEMRMLLGVGLLLRRQAYGFRIRAPFFYLTSDLDDIGRSQGVLVGWRAYDSPGSKFLHISALDDSDLTRVRLVRDINSKA